MSNSKPKSIFDNRHETSSQEVYLRRCGFALQETPSDSEPSVKVVSPMQVDKPNAETDSSDSEPVTAAICEQESNEIIRLVSPETSAEMTADSSDSERLIAAICEQQSNEIIRLVSPETSVEETADLVANIEAETKKAVEAVLEIQEEDSIAMEIPGNISDRPISSSGNRKGKSVESPVEENRGKEPKIPFREVIRAILMNSRDGKEEDETEPLSCVKALESIGVKFPHYPKYKEK